jgi:transposase-like protein
MPRAVALLKKMMRRRLKPVHLVVDGLPVHKTALVKDYGRIDQRTADPSFFTRICSRTEP